MKRLLSVALVLVFLSGCAVQTKPAASNEESAPSTSVPQAMPSTTIGSSEPIPALMPTASVQPTLPETPTPSVSTDEAQSTGQDDSPYFVTLDAEAMTGADISQYCVTNGNIVYYRSDCYETDSDATYTKIYQHNISDGKTTEVLSSKGRGYIRQLFVDEGGTLYYTLAKDNCSDDTMPLFKLNGGKSIQITNGIASMLYSENGQLYCCTGIDEDTGVPSRFAVTDLKTGTTTNLNESNALINRLKYGHYKIVCSNTDGTNFDVTDTLTGVAKKLHFDISMQGIKYAFVYGNVLFVVDIDYSKQVSTIYRIDMDTQKVLPVHTVSGQIDGSAFYNSQWYFFTWLDSEDEDPVNQRIDVCDLSSGKVSLYKKAVILDDHLEWADIEAGCGYLWTFECGDGDGTYLYYHTSIPIK